jgi:hypothetical protein
VSLNYELYTYETYILDNPIPVIYKIDNLGTEQVLPEGIDSNGIPNTSPLKCDIQYGIDTTDIANNILYSKDYNTTYTFAEGSTDGAFSVTPSNGSETSINVHGVVKTSGDQTISGVKTFNSAPDVSSCGITVSAGSS